MKKPTLSDISPNSQKLIAVCLVLFVAIFSYDWILAPHCGYLQASQRKSRFSELLQKKTQDLERRSERFGRKVDELKAARSRAGQRLFDESGAQTFFADLPAAAGECGCRIDSVTFRTLKNSREWIDLPALDPATVQFRSVRMRLEGPYDGWIRFLEKVESAGRIMRISCFEMVTGSESNQRLRGELEIVVPILLEIPDTLVTPYALSEEVEKGSDKDQRE